MLEHVVTKQLYAKIARCFIDLNRDPQQIGSDYPDGLFKQVDLLGKKIYKNS